MFAMLMNWMKANKMLPQISDTERMALEAGSVWIERGFFDGNPDFREILAQPYNRLPVEEQAFLDGPVEELCRMVDRYEIERTRRVPEHVLEFIKRSGMMSLLIPKQYGGKQFSRLGISTILGKLGTVSGAMSTYVVIPNSIGASELIVHFGTDEQKQHYLPRFANGEYLSCFGLTEPTAGTDAAGMKAEAVTFKDGDGEIKLRLNFRKRYITLGPVADVATIACRLRDPQNLLGKGEHLGITCVLVHKGTPGFVSGDHHDPIGSPFDNGPLSGKDVVVPVMNIIGGAAGAGQGWRMLMALLAGSRMVALPAGAVAGAKAIAAVTGAYSMVRQQFGIPIGRMEGVEDKVGKIAALTYMMEGARVFGCSAVDSGQHPPVVSAVMKAYLTELGRELVTDAMDVFAGTGVMQGPNNILATGYKAGPVAVTVEGANIMTRTLMIFGQGATRCHPYALNVVQALEQHDVPLFRKNLVAWVGHFLVNFGRNAGRYLTRGWSAGAPVDGPTARYYRRLAWCATRFAILADIAMFTIGGKLKARGNLAGRYADALAWQVLALCALRRWEAEGRIAEDLPLVHYSVQYSLGKVQQAFGGIYRNFGAGPVGFWLRSVGSLLLRLNPVGDFPTDDLGHKSALTIQMPSEQLARLTQGLFSPVDETVGGGRLRKAFLLVSAAWPILAKIYVAQQARKLPRGAPEELAQEASNKNIITAEEASLVRKATAARLEAIEVDAFPPDQYYRAGSASGALSFEAALKRAANV